MRNRLFGVRQAIGFLALAACLSPVGSAVQPQYIPQTGASALAVPPTQTWEERLREVLLRVNLKLGGDQAAISALPLKTAAIAVNTQFLLFGLLEGLTASELEQLERDALELADCAEWEPGPPAGTSYGVIVLLHDLGKAVHAAAVAH